MKRALFKTAFILGAGKGVRLKPLTDLTPKPLLEMGGRPIITYAMEHLKGIGIERFIINIHHLPDKFIKAFPEKVYKNIPIVFRYEPVLLETGGGLKNIEDLLKDDEAIICYNSDIITNLPLEKLIETHIQHRSIATLVLRSEGHNKNVVIDEEGNIIDMRFTFGRKGVKTCLFTGIYAVEKKILDWVEQKKAISIVSVFLKIIQEKPGSIRGVIIDEGVWHDTGTLEAFFRLKSSFKGFDAG
ncbi:MAG TPA: sugar phosphate nucleotidyltransferase [Syntrophorhabdaceae bacterium]|nr:sugar phosphate nucleotidyltransferase [Syntrophorhabdaceae bacterium]HPP06860.1 sugar phosphate nucleotidyltransferase [Syntrophorhabdaceae bacterium]